MIQLKPIMHRAGMSLSLLFLFLTLVSQENFKCGDDLVDPRDGAVYKTVLIDGQCWLAENLNYGQTVENNLQLNNGIVEKTCYENEIKNCGTYGGLYTWNEAMQYEESNEGYVQGVCPTGWHLPSKEEWEKLALYAGKDSAGYRLKASPTDDVIWDGNNELGYNILPAGTGNGPYFQRMGNWAVFWSSTPYSGKYAWFSMAETFYNHRPPKYHILYIGNYYLKQNSFSVRCLKNND